MSGTPRPSGLPKLCSVNGLGQATGENPLEFAGMLAANALEESFHIFGLEVPVTVWVLVTKEEREAASGIAICDFACIARRTADRTANTSDQGTFQMSGERLVHVTLYRL